MRALGHAVQDALAAVDAGHRAPHRPLEIICKPGGVRVAVAGGVDDGGLARDAVENFLGRIDESLRQAIDALDLVVPRLRCQ